MIIGLCLYCGTYGPHDCRAPNYRPFGPIKPVDTSQAYEKYQTPKFISPGPELEKRKDEALWTKFFKTSFLVHRGRNTSIDSQAIAQLAGTDADAMLAAHKKRWGHE